MTAAPGFDHGRSKIDEPRHFRFAVLRVRVELVIDSVGVFALLWKKSRGPRPVGSSAAAAPFGSRPAAIQASIKSGGASWAR